MSRPLAPLLAALLGTFASPLFADGRQPGSVLIFPIQRSGAGFTVVSVTNVNTEPAGQASPGGTTNAFYQYLNTVPGPGGSALPVDCYVIDRVEQLTPADTLSVLTSCHNAAAAEGYLVVAAANPLTGLGKDAWSFNHLVGSELVMNASGGVYSTNAIPFLSLRPDRAPTDFDGDGQYDFDGIEYEPVAEELYADQFLAIAGSSLTLINLTGGAQFTAVASFDVWNDSEQPLSATKAFRCWFEESLPEVSPVFLDSYLANNTPNDPTELDLNCDGVGDLETGWMRIRGNVASSSAESIANPAFLGAITAGSGFAPPGAVGGINGGRLLWESSATQTNGDFLNFSVTAAESLVNTRLDTDSDANNSRDAQICCEDDNVYVVWKDQRSGDQIFFNRSTDGGETWLDTDVRIDHDPTDSAERPQISCDGDNVYVVWEDSRAGDSGIYFNYSTDLGATWQATDTQLDRDVVASTQTQPRICCEDDQVYVAWSDHRNGLADLYSNRSTDGGATWLVADVRIDTDVAGAAESLGLELACEGTKVYATWQDKRGGVLDIFFNVSTNGGASWGASDTMLNSVSVGSGPASLCNDGSRVYVVWQDIRDGLPDIRFNRSLDDGATWLASDVRLDTDGAGAGASARAKICCEGASVHVVWEDERNTGSQIFYNRSTDSGTTWLTSDERIDHGPLGARAQQPEICCDDQEVSVVWRDTRNGGSSEQDIYANRSSNGGVSWLGADVRVSNTVPGTASAIRPALCCEGEDAHVVWSDDRNGFLDVFSAKLP